MSTLQLDDDGGTRHEIAKLLYRKFENQSKNTQLPLVCVTEHRNLTYGHERLPFYLEELNTDHRNGLYMDSTAITEELEIGNVMHFEWEIKPGTSEILELSSHPVFKNETDTVNILFYLEIYNGVNLFTEPKKNETYELAISSGDSLKFVNTPPETLKKMKTFKVPLKKPLKNTLRLEVLFEKDHAEFKFSDGEMEEKVNVKYTFRPGNRYYINKYLYEAQLLDVHVMQSNKCSKKMYEFAQNQGEVVFNCHWTLTTFSIPTYSCQKPSFIACQVEVEQSDNGTIVYTFLFFAVLLVISSIALVIFPLFYKIGST